ncbi:amino acid adenylation domain-containing protein [Kitasatospora sp. NPDC058162]|uniref:non-ribosomal peptide synthetase n=1 Tax=Kitasatospora sp. NPDC058162 TaxID=3346362 RepID=UPI0036DC61D8
MGTSDNRTGADLFAAVAANHPTAPAVRHGSHLLTYAELAGRAGALAEELRARGIGPGDVVATLLERSVSGPVAMLGTWAVGAAYVHLDASESQERVDRMLSAAGGKVVLVDSRTEERLAGGSVELLRVAELGTADFRLAPGRSGSDLAYLVFTSGSTGLPKAVAVEHRNVLGYAAAFRTRIAPLTPNSFGTATTFASDLGNTSVFGALLHGARLDVYDREVVLDPAAFAAELGRHPVDCLKSTPSQIEALARIGELGKLLPGELLVLGGEALPPRLARSIVDTRPDLTVFNHYGPSETTVGVLMHRVTPATAVRSRVPVGTPLAGTTVTILGDDGEPVTDGTPGQLHLAGAGVGRGYHGDAALTAEKFHRHAWGRCYASGDLAVLNADGDIEILGRMDRQIKIRGYRVEPAEVEHALNAHPGVRGQLVVGEESAVGGPMELVAYVIASADPADLMRHLSARLPSWCVPGRIHVVDAIPVTVNGKADLAALRELAIAQAESAPEAPAADGPRNDVERFIAEIWGDVLGRESIGVHAKFLELGGNSFKSLTVFGKLRRRFPELTVSTLFAHPTVAELARALTDAPLPAVATTAVEL